jgi:hypothetical protein
MIRVVYVDAKHFTSINLSNAYSATSSQRIVIRFQAATDGAFKNDERRQKQDGPDCAAP